MPLVSQAQRGAMYSAKAGKSTLGIPQSVGAEFVAADKGGKLPARAKKKKASKSSAPKGLAERAFPRGY
jgi:hypothetical protein